MGKGRGLKSDLDFLTWDMEQKKYKEFDRIRRENRIKEKAKKAKQEKTK